ILTCLQNYYIEDQKSGYGNRPLVLCSMLDAAPRSATSERLPLSSAPEDSLMRSALTLDQERDTGFQMHLPGSKEVLMQPPAASATKDRNRQIDSDCPPSNLV